MILQDMKNLLAFLPGLKRLELVDLELDGFDGKRQIFIFIGKKTKRIRIISYIRSYKYIFFRF